MVGVWQHVAWEDVEDSLVVPRDVQDLWRAVVEDESGERAFLHDPA